jgi:hypothetical protein
MDSFEFAAALVDSLAWPLFLGVLLFFYRKRLTQLADRLRKLWLPGGVRIDFRKELAVGRLIAEQAVRTLQIAPPTDERSKLERVAIEAPEGAIVLAYIDLEKILNEIALKLGKRPTVKNHRAIVQELATRELLGADAATLFDSVIRARKSALHGMAEEDVTTAEAVEFIDQVNILIELLRVAATRL